MNNIDNYAAQLFKKAKKAGFAECEVYCKKSASFGADIFEGEIKEYKNANAAGLSFRGNYKGKTGYAYTETLTDSAMDFLIDGARQNAGISDEDKEFITSPGGDYAVIADRDISQWPAEKKIETAKKMEQTALNTDSRVVKSLHSYIGDGTSDVLIINTRGLTLRKTNSHAYAYVYAEARENGQTKTGGEFYSWNDFSYLDYEALAQAAVKTTCGLLGARDIAKGAADVIFDNMSMAELLACYAGIFYAENTQKGFSLLTGDKGEGKHIASKAVNILDYTAHSKSPIKNAFDDEGGNSYDKAVITDGVLQTLLYNQKSAAKEDRPTTGNGFKPSFKSSITTGCMNFFIAPSEITESDLFKEAGTGVYITNLSGLHAGTNAVTGDFSIKADGYRIENGKKSYPIEQFTVAGNFYDLMQKITAVSDNLRFDMPHGSGCFGAPSVLVRDLNISGGA